MPAAHAARVEGGCHFQASKMVYLNPARECTATLQVRVSEVEHLISELPYCDVELEMEHPAPDVLIG